MGRLIPVRSAEGAGVDDVDADALDPVRANPVDHAVAQGLLLVGSHGVDGGP